MKNKFWTLGIAAAFSLSTAYTKAQSDSTGLAGDNFDLYGALDLFKQSESTEAFEKAINDKDNGINNLDLNADGKVDYVKVVDHSAGDNKVLILQDIISENESQDVAVVEMEKKGNDVVHLQIVGDEAMYGKNYIVEPKDNNVKSEAAPAPTEKVRTHVYVNVWGWPGVRWMYGPSYVVWGSPFHWGYYPPWWSPWDPFAWHVYHPRVIHYHYPYYHRVYVYRVPNAHKVYYGHRTTSTVVVNRNRTTNNTVVHREVNVNRKATNPHPKQRQAEVQRQKQMRDQQHRSHAKQERKAIKHEQRREKKDVHGPRK